MAAAQQDNEMLQIIKTDADNENKDIFFYKFSVNKNKNADSNRIEKNIIKQKKK